MEITWLNVSVTLGKCLIEIFDRETDLLSLWKWDVELSKTTPEEKAGHLYIGCVFWVSVTKMSTTRRPSLPPMPDLSHLKEEERKHIEDVLKRQRDEEDREQDMIRYEFLTYRRHIGNYGGARWGTICCIDFYSWGLLLYIYWCYKSNGQFSWPINNQAGIKWWYWILINYWNTGLSSYSHTFNHTQDYYSQEKKPNTLKDTPGL